MTSPCQNCHASPEAKAPQPSILRLSDDVPESPLAQTCNAQNHWPAWLKEPVPALNGLEWWTRSNFEKTLQTKTKAEGRPALPFRISIGEADLDANLIPNSIALDFLPNREKFYATHHRLFIIPGENALVTSHLEIRENQIPLLMKSLMDFQGINVGLEKSLVGEAQPNQITVGNYGDLHAILTPQALTGGLLNLLTPPGTPVMPVGYDWPHGDENMNPACANPGEGEAEGLDCPPVSSWIYQDPNEPRRDVVLTGILPPELLTEQGRLPKAFGVEDLIGRIMALITRRKDIPKKENPAFDLKQLLEVGHLKPGSKITLAIKDLRDFFIPGIIDLGPSEGTITLEIQDDQKIHIDMESFTLNLEAMDYPAKSTLQMPEPDGCQPAAHVNLERPGTRLKYGMIYPGFERKNEAGEPWKPGIHLVFDPKSKQLSVSANLHVEAALEDREGGGNVLFATGLALTEEGLRPIPKTTTIELRDWNLFKTPPPPSEDKKKKAKAPEPGENLIVQDLSVSLTDDPHLKGGRSFLEALDDPTFLLRASAWLPGEPKAVPGKKAKELPLHRLNVDAHLAVPRAADGSYDLSSLLTRSTLSGDIVFSKDNGPKKPPEVFTAKINLGHTDTLISRRISTFDIDYTLRVSLDRYFKTDEAKRKRHPELPEWDTQAILTGGVITLSREPVGCSYRWGLDALAKQIRWPMDPNTAQKFQWEDGKDDLLINGFSGEINVDHFHLTQDSVDLSVPVFSLVANAKGSDSGPVRGKVALVQSPDQRVNFFWDWAAKEAKIGGIDLQIEAQGLSFLTKGLKTMLDPRASSIGVDGHLLGDFKMYVPKDFSKWNGNGLFLLKGDHDGDVYFLDKAGSRIGPPLIRDTQWHFKRVDSVNTVRGYALGDFYLGLVINIGALNLFSGGTTLPAFDPKEMVGGLGPFETIWEMGYNNQPWTPKGFQNRADDYVGSLCRDIPECVDAMRKIIAKQQEGTP